MYFLLKIVVMYKISKYAAKTPLSVTSSSYIVGLDTFNGYLPEKTDEAIEFTQHPY